MKRILVLLCALLLLCGCSQAKKAASQSTAPQTEPTGAYIADHGVETASGGAVRAYGIGGTGMAVTSDGVVVWSAGKLSVYDTDEGKLLYQSASVSDVLAVEEGLVYYENDGISCYDYRSEKTRHWDLPEDVQGAFAIGTQTGEIYYGVSGMIYAMNMDSGITRMLKSHSAQEQTITGAYFGGSVIGWETENGISYLSTADGSLLSSEQGIRGLQTQGDSYFVLRLDGMVEQVITGTEDGEPLLVNLPGEQLVPAFQMNGLLQISEDLTLSFYDLTTGQKCAQVTVPEAIGFNAIAAADGFVWILTENTLYRWEIAKSPAEDETTYVSTLYTPENPDPEGMAQCQSRVDQMNRDYGVRIHIGADAVSEPGEHVLTMEHQPLAIQAMLDSLEPLLQHFPESFLRKTVASGWVRICLVRSVDNTAQYARYWVDGDCYIAIALDADMTEAFLAGFGGAVDSHILGHSRDLEYWNKANPKGFSYIADGIVPEEYAQYVGTHFVDEAAMTYPNEDRARLFYYAMAEGNEELFAQSALQKKLKMLCEGIREAYDLKKSPETFLWEQYLEDSLAYTK